MNELNMYRLELRDIYYEPCPGMNLIVTASRTFQKNQIIFSLICSEFAYFRPKLLYLLSFISESVKKR